MLHIIHQSRQQIGNLEHINRIRVLRKTSWSPFKKYHIHVIAKRKEKKYFFLPNLRGTFELQEMQHNTGITKPNKRDSFSEIMLCTWWWFSNIRIKEIAKHIFI